MATNSAFANGDQLSLPVPDGTASGDPVLVGQLVGVALTDEGAEGNADNFATVKLDGAFHLDVAGTVTAVGQPVYIDTAGDLTATAGTNALFGHALATGADTNLPVRLVGASTTPLAAS